MSLKLYNTVDRRVVDFIPLEAGKAGLYCCGPTVYNFAHIGNLRTYIFEDLLHRTLELAGFKVKHVMNVTDVGHLTSDGDEGEDKMIKASREKGMTPWDIAAFFTEAFFQDCQELNILTPQVVCKATDHVGEMIGLISRLESAGLTYTAGGNVYFDTGRFPNYGKMALLDKQDQTLQFARVAGDENKKNPKDFALWFTKGKFEDQAMVWDSPWGKGYPGWHIECSAMSIKYLGEHFDIHCGGVDHIPVHHTNEIAQSEGAVGHKWVNYWLHAEFLLLQKEKMSKSSGSFLTLKALREEGYDSLDYRYFCLGGHYRTQLVFSFEALDAARSARKSLCEKVLQYKAETGGVLPDTISPLAQKYSQEFEGALFNDLNLPQALAKLWTLIKDSEVKPEDKLVVLYRMDQVLGLQLESLQPKVLEIPQEVTALAQQRLTAREQKNWAESDRLRDEILLKGWIVEDLKPGFKLKPAL
ncbi:MAG: cysteine--tRNA ligase [Spirochaetes bacterium GWB1_48_6]|nr:MAG: cysteine--tRNA ligase [Spirochaetes bacterium GWB1_48_6]